MRLRTRALLVAGVLASAAGIVPTTPAAAAAPTSWVLTGPAADSPAAALVALAGGALTFGVTHNGATVLAPAPIGIDTSLADFGRELKFLGRTDKRVEQHYVMTTGKQKRRDSVAAESTLMFSGTGGARVNLVIRVADDGAAYRWVLPGTGAVTVLREASSYSLPAGAAAWLLPYTSNYEATRVETTAGAAATGDYGYPSLFEVNGTYVLLTEADISGRYSGSRLAHEAGTGTYTLKLDDAQVTGTRQLTTPWRTAIVGDLPTVTESTLVDDLAPWSKIDDTSWIRPGAVAWSWLSEHNSPRDPVRQKQYVDFAARNGWPYVLIDEGWNSTWVPDVTRYARARGVDVILWYHWSSLDTQAERDAAFATITKWGVKGVKVDFMDSDTQARFQWYDAILADTARHKLMINFHGATIPRGYQRTWPHVMTHEGIRGAEQFKTRAATNTMFPFTRNVVGGMDYTPVAFVVSDRDTTDAHEVATFLVYESGWQHGADKPENYESRPEALRTLDQIPTTWDETKLLQGRPGQEVVIARRDGQRWYVGGISAVPAKTVAPALGFLGAGQYLQETLRDGPHGLIRETRVVTSADALNVPVASNGGFVSVLCPYRDKLRTCDRPLRKVPATNLAITPADANVQRGVPLTVNGTFSLPAGAAITDVSLSAVAPAGWTVSGAPVTAASLAAGESITGSWQLTATDAAPTGTADLPVVATFSFPKDPAKRGVHVEQVVRVLLPPPTPSGTVFVSDLPFLSETNAWGPVERDKSNGESGSGDGRPLSIRGKTYPKGLGVHAESDIVVWLGGACSSFTAEVGVDDEVSSPGSVEFQVIGDGNALGTSGVVRSADQPKPLTVDVTGVQRLTLRVTAGGDGRNFDHADWSSASLSCAAR